MSYFYVCHITVSHTVRPEWRGNKNVQPLKGEMWPAHPFANTHARQWNKTNCKLCVSGSMSVLLKWEVSAALERGSLAFSVEGQRLPKENVEVSLHTSLRHMNNAGSFLPMSGTHRAYKHPQRQKGEEPRDRRGHSCDRSLIKHRLTNIVFHVFPCVRAEVCAADSGTVSRAPQIKHHAGSFNKMLNNWLLPGNEKVAGVCVLVCVCGCCSYYATLAEAVYEFISQGFRTKANPVDESKFPW